MAAITDLTWQQVLDKLPASSIVLTGGKVLIDVGAVANLTADALTDAGVIKFVATLMGAAYAAQQTANEGQTTGERLAAFGAPANGAINSGYVPITRSFVSRSELASATNIVGQVS